MTDNYTNNDLIARLSNDLKPVKPLAHPYIRAGKYLGLSIAYIALAILFLGFRPDILQMLSKLYFIFEIILMFAMGVTAYLCSSLLCIPDALSKKYVLKIPFIFTGIFTIWALIQGASQVIFAKSHVHELFWYSCINDAFFIGFIPAIFIGFLTIRTSTTRPYLLMITNTIAITGLGYIGLAFTCSHTNIIHGCLYHILPFVLTGLVIGMFSRRIYRW